MKDSSNIKTIGLILEDAFTDFCSDIIHSVSFVVKDMNANYGLRRPFARSFRATVTEK